VTKQASEKPIAPLRMLIGGKLMAGAGSMDVINPADEEVIAACPRVSKEQLDAAVAAARAAFPSWKTLDWKDRQTCLARIADAIDNHTSELARILTLEQGKPLSDATAEVQGTSGFFRYFAGLPEPEWDKAAKTGEAVQIRRRPLGVVAAITPWNFPLALMAFKVPPALLTGNTVVLKPAGTTPLATLRFGEIVSGIVPPGVLNVISDANDMGAELTGHPDVDKISFTGSTAVGRKVMASAAETLKRVTLELGGNDPAIVLPDVDPTDVAKKIFQSAFQNAGQICIAVKRAYVHEAIYDRMCTELAQLADKAVVGDGFDANVQIGPIQNKKQYEKVLEFIEDGRSNGKIIAGGEPVGNRGFFLKPTIVRDIEDGTRLVDEEQFGPVLPVIKFSDIDSVVARANNSPYGLGASVWSGDTEKARALAGDLEAGTVWVNKHLDLAPNIPFAGAKSSGLGSELGDEGLMEFTQLHVINVGV
jgi:acyl-CoA reductase-like NAD-dependent aldehyde dehydrogenase